MKKTTHSPFTISSFVTRIVGIGMLLALLITTSIPALACACCSQTGQRYETTNKIEEIEQEILQAIKFGPIAKLFSRADDAIGLIDMSLRDDETLSEFDILSTFSPNLLTFRLSHAGKDRGTIRFPQPQHISKFLVDIHDGKTSKDMHGPALYKEWRLNGTATLSGLAIKGTHKAKVRLVLQGRGIACPTVEDFSHWSIAVDGKQVKFRLIGGLER